jgi:hypothetical protein
LIITDAVIASILAASYMATGCNFAHFGPKTLNLVFLIRQDAHTIDRKAAVEASADTTHSRHVIMLFALMPSLAMWMPLESMRRRQP